MQHTTFLFTGGGTGGHLFPGLAVAEELRDRLPTARVVFAGSERGIERDIVERAGVEHRVLSVEPSTTLRRHPLRFAWRSWKALRAARCLLKQERPAVVIGLGGFASVPMVLAASRLGIPIVLLEQNMVPGRATRWLASRARLVCTSFTETATVLPKFVDVRLTGNPVRREIAALVGATLEDGLQSSPPLRGGKTSPATEWRATLMPPTLVILGGSQGATAVNDAVLAAADTLRGFLTGWHILHQTGTHDEARVRARYSELNLPATVSAFIDDMPALYRTATLVISRAGATSLAELACAGCPAVLIPYPNSIGNHQFWNAWAYADAGGAVMVEQADTAAGTAERLTDALRRLLIDSDARTRMQAGMREMALPEAAVTVALEVLRLAGASPTVRSA